MASAPSNSTCSQSLTFDLQAAANIVLLFFLMLGCGMTISYDEFMATFKSPKGMIVAMFGQFLFLPLFGFAMAEAFQLNALHSVGLIAIVTAPGGSSSNIFALLYQADVALSVAATTFSSFLAIGLMPLNQYLYISVGGLAQGVCFQVLGIVLSAIVVLVGVFLGVFLKPRLQEKKMFMTVKVLFFLASLSAFAIISLAIVTNVISSVPFYRVPGTVAAAAIITCLLGVGYAFIASTLAKFEPSTRVTICLEVGIQNAFVAFAVIQLVFTGSDRDIAISAPAIYSIFGLFLSFAGCTLAWKCGQTRLDPHSSFIKAFKDARQKQREEREREIYGGSITEPIAPGLGDAKVADETSKA